MSKWILPFILSLLISGCTTESSPDPDPNTNPAPAPAQIQPLEVEFMWSPNPGQVGEAINLQVTVSQGEEQVDDAGEVLFEIWQEGQEEHEMIQATPQGEGRYAIQIVFPQAGSYHVIYHVNARDMHSMNKAELIVEDN